jgi:integrase/recombinase XerC
MPRRQNVATPPASTASPHPPDAPAIKDLAGAQAVFDAWVASSTATGAVKPETIASYQKVWTPWLRFLAGRGRRWDEAGAGDFGEFLDSLGHSPYLRVMPSHVTQRRYWNVLGKIYGHAFRAGLIPHSPVVLANRPAQTEAAASVAIYPHYLEKLRELLPDLEGPMGLRDRALIAVLVDVGLTTQELIDLKPEGVSGSTVHSGYFLRVTGVRPPQNRVLQLGKTASRALKDWLDARDELTNPADRVFVSMRGHKALEPSDVLFVARWWLHAAAPAVDLPIVDHMGTNSLRNAVLIWWRDKVKLPLEEIAARAGLSETRALLRLPSATASTEA